MSYLLKRVLLNVFLCLLLIACEKENLSNEIVVNDVEMHYEAMELEVTKLVNNYRTQKDLPKLEVLNLISLEAESHSLYMLDNEVLSHDNFDLRTQNLIDNIGAKNVAENVAFGYQSAEKFLEGWLKSPEHCKNIEARYFTHFGVSAKINEDGNYYVTQIFIERSK